LVCGEDVLRLKFNASAGVAFVELDGHPGSADFDAFRSA